MERIAAVYQSLKRRRSDQEKADKLGLPLPQYLLLKNKVTDAIEDISDVIDKHIIEYLTQRLVKGADGSFSGMALDNSLSEIQREKIASSPVIEQHVDLENGTSKISALVATEPRSAEEIVDLLQIDTRRWKLSQYWNKEKSDKWLVSALVTRLPEEQVAHESFLDILQHRALPLLTPFSKDHELLNSAADQKVCGILSLQDMHFGKTGNEDMHEILQRCIASLLTKAYNNYYLEELVFVVGGDALNMDTFNNTTTKGTPMEYGELPTDAYVKAFDAHVEAIATMKQFCERLKVVYIPGNHDRLSSFHMVHALAQVFKSWTDVEFDSMYSERKVHTYGVNMFCFEHGDVASGTTPLLYATEFPTQWGESTFRTLYIGHLHTRKTREVVTENEVHGFSTKLLPSLSATDYYHYHNKWTGNKRAGVLELHDEQSGKTGEFVFTV